MSRYTVGIDVAIRGDPVAVIIDEECREVKTVRFGVSYEGYEKLRKELEKLEEEGEKAEVVVSPTGTVWVGLAAYLKSREYRVYLLSPNREHDLRKYLRKSAKTDRIDGYVLALARRVEPETVYEYDIPEGLKDSLKRWTRRRSELVEEASGIWKRIGSTVDLACPGIWTGFGSRLRSAVGKAFLRKYMDPGKGVAMGRLRLNRFLDKYSGGREIGEEAKEAIWSACVSGAAIYRESRERGEMPFESEQIGEMVRLELKRLAQTEKWIKEAEKRIEELYDRYDPEGVLLQPSGIGKISSACLVGANGSLERFGSLRKYKGYTGMSPGKKETGGVEKEGQKMTQQSDPLLRRTLYLVGETARRHDVESFELYQRLLDRGRHHSQAVVAVGAQMGRRYLSLQRRHEARRGGEGNVDVKWRHRDGSGKEITKEKARAWIEQEGPRRKAYRELSKRGRVGGRKRRSEEERRREKKEPKGAERIEAILLRDPKLARLLELVEKRAQDEARRKNRGRR